MKGFFNQHSDENRLFDDLRGSNDANSVAM